MLWRSTNELISDCSRSFSISALAMRSTILVVLGAVLARALDLAGILGGLMLASDLGGLGGLILASEILEFCRPCLRG